MDGFATRWRGKELMDDPQGDVRKLHLTLAQFSLLNRLVSRYRLILSRWVLDDMARAPSRAYRLIDAGAGGGDIASWLADEARRRGLCLEVIAVDSDPRAVFFARDRLGHRNGLRIEAGDIFDLQRFDPVDYVFCNHVLHHFDDADLDRAFLAIDAVARRRWLVSDLIRSRWSYLAFHAIGPFFGDSFTFEDGRRSIRRGFRSDEIRALLATLPLRCHVEINTLMPWRILIIGDRIAGPQT